MTRMKMLFIVAVLVVPSVAFAASLAFAGRPALGQTAPQTPQRETDPIVALTAEFRALRAELSAAAAASLRLQMLVARLQAQEQRIIYLDRLRSEVAARRSIAEQGRNEVAMRIGNLSGEETARLDPEKRREVELQLQSEKSRLALQDRALQQIQAEETDAVNALAQEQAAGTTSTHASTSWNGPSRSGDGPPGRFSHWRSTRGAFPKSLVLGSGSLVRTLVPGRAWSSVLGVLIPTTP
jgi:hypothetical protein